MDRIKRLSNTAFANLIMLGLIFWGFARLPAQKHGENHYFSKLGLMDGLSQVTVNAIIQDSNGFIYIGTEGGLNLYDGHSIRIYSRTPGKAGGLPDNAITELFRGSGHDIWIGSKKGYLIRFNPGNRRFRTEILNFGSVPGGDTRFEIQDIIEDTQNPDILWIGTIGGGLVRFSKKKGVQAIERSHTDRPDSIRSNIIYSITTDRNQPDRFLWIGTDKGLDCYDRLGKQFNCFGHHNMDFASDIRYKIKSIVFDRHGRLYLGSYGNGLIKLNFKEKKKSRLHNSGIDGRSDQFNHINTMLMDSRGQLWIGSDSGLSRYDPETKAFANHRHRRHVPWSLSDNQVISLYEDGSRNIWIGTWYKGVNKLDIKPVKFKSMPLDTPKGDQISFHVIRDIHSDRDDNLWIGTLNGLKMVQKNSGTRVTFQASQSDPGSISNDYIMDIYTDHQGTTWIGTKNGLNRFNRKNGRFKTYFHRPGDSRSLSSNHIQRIIDDRQQSERYLWIATRDSGLNRMDKDSGHCKRYIHSKNDPSGLAHNKVYTLHYDRNNTLWIGTWKGLNRYIPETDRFVKYRSKPEAGAPLDNEMITCIADGIENEGNVLWIGTWGGGLFRFDISGNQTKRYTVQDGLGANLISGIVQDRTGIIWISSPNGISRLDPGLNTIKHYTVRVGEQNNAFNAGAYLQHDSGEIFFGGIYGLTHFRPESVIDNPYPPKVRLTTFRIFHREVVPKDYMNQVGEMMLSHRDNFFTIEFAGLEYTDPDKNRYAYKLRGFDKHWRFTGSKSRSATYMNLDAGRYDFVIKAANNDGTWGQAESLIKIQMIPPFWETTAFRLLIVTIVLLIILLVFRLRLRQINQWNRRLKNLVRRKTEFLQKTNDALTQERNRAISLSDELATKNLVLQEQIEKRKAIEQKLIEQATIDSLTGLFNRRHFVNICNIELKRVDRYSRNISLLMIDADHFKAINDSHGHNVGDRVLVKLSECFKTVFRATDICSRIGGEEFAVLLTETSIENARIAAERCHTMVRDQSVVTDEGKTVKFTVSIGIAKYPENNTADLEQLMKMADIALYAAKDKGRDQTYIYEYQV